MNKFGWLPDLPDVRDRLHKATSTEPLPEYVDLRSLCPTVYDQGNLGSCVANAVGAAYELLLLKDGEKPDFHPSRLFTYYNARIAIGTVRSDSGCMIRDAIKSVVKDGVCPETIWPYRTAAFSQKPPQSCYAEAKKHQALVYERVGQDDVSLKRCLYEGYPISFGFAVYQNFGLDWKHVMNVPEGRVRGGHAVLMVGYDDALNAFIVRNSWGSAWGEDGYFWMPYEYAFSPSFADDFWVLKEVE